MMISPQSFINECKDKKYAQLIQIREGLLADIRYFEKHKDEADEELIICPSPEVVYQMNLKYLGKVCELISDKYNDEFIWKNEEVDCDLLIENIERLHTTKLGMDRIKKNLSLNTDNVVSWCKEIILKPEAYISKKGKNWYINVDGYKITVNGSSFNIITAHRQSK